MRRVVDVGRSHAAPVRLLQVAVVAAVLEPPLPVAVHAVGALLEPGAPLALRMK